MLRNKKILLGITGAISAYKSIELVRKLRKRGAWVRVIMTSAAKAFVTPLTFQIVSGFSVSSELFSVKDISGIKHIDLARWGEQILVAPASADFISRLAYGQANDLLTTLCLATEMPIAIAPSMNQKMWRNKITQANIHRLKKYGIEIFGPETGIQACGDFGPGRLLEPKKLINCLEKTIRKILTTKQVVITAGPTREIIDPVRYLTNRSSGKMGYALAEAATVMGATVTLISGPTNLLSSKKINRINVITAQEMFTAVMHEIAQCNIFISAAAVSDYRPTLIETTKIKRNKTNLTLNLIRNPDIISRVSCLPNKPFIVGFALETANHLKNAQIKLKQKNMDMIVLNSEKACEGDKNAVTVINRLGEIKNFSLKRKSHLAINLMRLIAENFHLQYKK
ncbi:bifunctional phosphopantothenoylcysteine decarboxylase/phosphopantothenate--cysteine ligase CoaBC [Coxiella endosymbiont of Amblyomma americanum]|uniref:bifunctional phosphopantothenoylcysteine decarboxylase/phosphopantothenate--cysteine ligase CoaBC n=2 Tax=Coxiellaceae TaxID=118968 RepID=UPI00057F5B6B|nr:bifunctional phosphopantothenoylcysteine decarboxylase/phosphopantothenate--cysteine ligase CoaBC [Coxiella endosymbiont of Amblyomma americanum]AJC50565.1 phosphopantothenoylcysteine decarboxylase [Coxiella endosymbiont of Amblyomma americanum]AUJ58898.1 bifunctional 4'-phosphopantothenoylcysteine decarboxylase/phosphopantothenoylcysteine synthetase [Coxiella-like endosymbiont of Amblyomma americanum]